MVELIETNKLTVLFPITQHNGESNLNHIDTAKAIISKVAGGYTSHRVAGGWYDVHTGILYADASELVYTYCDDAHLELLLDFTPTWAELLQQIELTVEVSKVKVAFVAGTRAQDKSNDTVPLEEPVANARYTDDPTYGSFSL